MQMKTKKVCSTMNSFLIQSANKNNKTSKPMIPNFTREVHLKPAILQLMYHLQNKQYTITQEDLQYSIKISHQL